MGCKELSDRWVSDRLNGNYHLVNSEEGQMIGDNPEIDGQLTITVG
jgi:hypothetical protein